MRTHVDASTSEPDLMHDMPSGQQGRPPEFGSKLHSVRDNWRGSNRRFRQKSSEPTSSPRYGAHHGPDGKGRRASVAGMLAGGVPGSNLRRASGIFDKILQQFKRATTVAPLDDEGKESKGQKKVKKGKGPGTVQDEPYTPRVKNWVKTAAQDVPEEVDDISQHVPKLPTQPPSTATDAVSTVKHEGAIVLPTDTAPSETTLQEVGPDFLLDAMQHRRPPTLTGPVLEALGLSFARPDTSSPSERSTETSVEVEEAVFEETELETAIYRRISVSSVIVSKSHPVPIRTILSFVPIAIQPDYLSSDQDRDDRRTRRKAKPSSLSPLSTGMSASSSHQSISSVRYQSIHESSGSTHLPASTSTTSLKKLSKSIASFGSSLFQNRSNASLPMRCSTSISSLGHAQESSQESRSTTESSRSLGLPSMSLSRVGGGAFRSFGDQTPPGGTLGRTFSRSTPRSRPDLNQFPFPQMSPPRSRLSYSEEHDQEQGHSSVSTSPGNSDVGNKSTSLPTQLATLPVPVSPGSLASKRSKSVDSDLNRRPPSPLKNTPGADKRMPTRQVVETSTIYAMHETSHTLFSPLGEPEETQGKVNQYHIIRDIGSGAYGRVVLCRNEQDQRYYACKIVSKSRLRKKFRWSNVGGNGSSHDDHLASIKKEVAILKKLSKHPNINALVEVLDDGKEDNLYMIFELCEFGPIMNLQLKESVSPFCEDLARRYFRDVVLGLEYLHSKRIIHRDLKPDNLLLKAAPPMGVVQIADFGISSMFEDGVEEPVLDDKNASPLFSPPEACQSHTKQLKGYAVDVWALGITLYCLVHGRAPWQDDSILLLYDKIVKAAAEISDSLSPSLQDLLYRMLRKNPDERISLAEVKVHPWSTNNGTEPMTSTEENCVFEDPTEEEVENAFQPAMMFVTKIMNRLKGKGGKKNNRTLSAPATPAYDDHPTTPLTSYFSDSGRASPSVESQEAHDLTSRSTGDGGGGAAKPAAVTKGPFAPLNLKLPEFQLLRKSRIPISASVDGLNQMPGSIAGLGLARPSRPLLQGRSRSFGEQGSVDTRSNPGTPSHSRSATPRAVVSTSASSQLPKELYPPEMSLRAAPITPATPRADSRRNARRASSMNIIDELPE